VRALLAGLLLALACAAPARAQDDPLAALRDSCRPQHGVRICEGLLPGFDGTPLDATVTLPARAPRKRALPLVVFLHGLLSDKGEYLNGRREGSDYKTIRWNNVWFASRGYAVLNYSARGHGSSQGQIELASKHVEVRDARRLIGLLVDDRRLARIDPAKVGVIGSSYGGGQAWLLMTTREDARLQFGSWRSPAGRLVRLAALVPGYTWTDLVQALVPNGRASNTPLGVPKITLVDGFIASAGTRLPQEVYGYLLRTTAGEPYEGDARVEEAKRALSEDRSAFYQDDYFRALRARRQRAVPVFAGQGVTDPIFSAAEAVRMARRLRQARRGYPIGMYFGDFEHLTSLVKLADLGMFHDLGTRFLDHHLRGRGRRPRSDVRMAVTNCDSQRFGPVLRARSWDALHPRHVTFELPGSQQTVSPLADPRGSESDPVVLSITRGRGCITTTRPPTAGIATWTVPVDRAFTLAGQPRLAFRFSAVATDITFTPRLWDVAPDGTQTLVTRGAWRSVGPEAAGGGIAFRLFGAAWRFARGHRLMLEIPQVDATYFRPDNFPSAASLEAVRLELPAAR
jgi:pimeloyl-ACP methyl ester carboxylesterase